MKNSHVSIIGGYLCAIVMAILAGKQNFDEPALGWVAIIFSLLATIEVLMLKKEKVEKVEE